MMKPKRILVLPYFLFTGVLVKKIQAAAAERDRACADTDIVCLPELGISPAVLASLHEREWEAQLGQIQMNCQLCKFRIAASEAAGPAHHHHGHDHHSHHHSHDHHGQHHHDRDSHSPDLQTVVVDPYANESTYHQRIWTVP